MKVIYIYIYLRKFDNHDDMHIIVQIATLYSPTVNALPLLVRYDIHAFNTVDVLHLKSHSMLCDTCGQGNIIYLLTAL